MFSSRALKFVFTFFILVFLILIAYNSNLHQKSWHGVAQNVGMGEWSSSHHSNSAGSSTPRVEFKPGNLKPVGEAYTKMLVTPRMQDENVDWMDQEIPDIPRMIYVADDPEAPLHPPKNKGHEVMIYLTYIIDHYENLSDVTLFMHNHRFAWHNAELFRSDAAEMIKRLSPERVQREGYVNMRCNWGPGCPDWMHPGETTEDNNKLEEVQLAKAWAELFPLDRIPEVLAQPCCAQFALSRQRIQAIPLGTFVFYRDWLLHTPYQDFISGRIWEYMWQYIFTGEASHCPNERICYCDGFGACFGSDEGYSRWYELKGQKDDINGEWLKWEDQGATITKLLEDGDYETANGMEPPKPGMDMEYKMQIDELQQEMDRLLTIALDRGADPKNRAKEAGRPWKEGDGF